ncbi:MAG: hypothetical protein QM785_06340 [Pyrinomonadaceae bacterium]
MVESTDNYEDIFYLNCPHFTIGRVDQWGEEGYLLHEGTVYAYEENRKDQCGETHSPRSITEFLAYAADREIVIPDDFMKLLLDADAAR